MMQVDEQEMIEVVRQHYLTCNGKPTPLAALKQHYGRDFSFKKTGLGNYGGWMEKNKHHFLVEQRTASFLNDLDTQLREEEVVVTEHSLLKTVKEYFSLSEYFSHRRHVLNHVRSIYGNRPFGDYGFGTFKQFIKKHNLDMGIAKRSDFRNFREWNKWKGRKEIEV